MEPLDSRISLMMRTVYGNCSTPGRTGSGCAGQCPVADLATAGPANRANFADTVAREVIVQHELLVVFLSQAINELLIQLVPSVTEHIACVSPRVKTAQP